MSERLPLFRDNAPPDSRDADSTDIDHHGRRVGQPRTWYGDREAWEQFVRLLDAKRSGHRNQNDVKGSDV